MDNALSRRLAATNHDAGILARRPEEGTRVALLVVDSRSNPLGLEVTLTKDAHAIEHLRAHRCGVVVATRLVERHQGRAIGGCVGFVAELTAEERAAIQRAFDEGVRILRDGQGLAGAAA